MLTLGPHQTPVARVSSIEPRPAGTAAGGAPVARDEADGESRRASPRRRVLRRALIVHRGGYCTLGCNILDVSETGAMLMPADMSLCPATFVLKHQDGRSNHCEVVWRKGEIIGVRFL